MFWKARRAGADAPPSHAPMAAPVALACATRAAEPDFWRDTLLGRSLPQAMAAAPGRLALHAAYGNTAGLSAVYNAVLDSLAETHIVVFVHDDVDLRDYHLCARLDEALARFDVVGVIGNAAPEADHAGWLQRRAADGAWHPHAPDRLAGVVDHRLPDGGHGMLAFDPAPREVRLIDGLFMAARVATLRRHGVRFDTRFAFHFYDLDFCRACTGAGLSIGTWPIALAHGSQGAFGTPDWEAGLATYRGKWGAR